MGKCIECGASFVGRSDKRYCSDQCRNEFHNKRNSDSNKIVRNINNILRKNRRILEELNPNGKSKVTRDALIIAGFNFFYYTNSFTTKQGKTYYFCYEQGYLELEDHMYALVIKQEYVK